MPASLSVPFALSLLLVASATNLPPTLNLMGRSGWQVVVDGVMGGKSTASLVWNNSSLTFAGVVSLDGGGFASIRRRLATPVDLSEYTGILVTYTMRSPEAETGGQRPISFQLGLEDRSRYTFGGAFAVAAASSAAAAGGVGQAYLPLATFKGHGWGSCSHCTFDASSVSEIDIYNLFQVGPFAATIRAVEAVAAPQQHTWTDPGLAARFGQPGAIAAELKGTIARGGYVYDKGYPHLCTALYVHTASVLISAASASGGVNGWESSVATATPGAAGVPGTQSAATQALCNALSFASAQAVDGTDENAAWAIRRAFDAVLAVVAAVEETVAVLSETEAAELAETIVKSQNQAHYPAAIQGGWLYSTDGAETLAQCSSAHFAGAAPTNGTGTGAGTGAVETAAAVDAENDQLYAYAGDSSDPSVTSSGSPLTRVVASAIVAAVVCVPPLFV